MRYLSINQVATRFDVHRKTVRAWISAGRLPAVRVGPRLIRINEDAVETLARSVPTRKPQD
jgi:excisionase family DNA binding protein